MPLAMHLRDADGAVGVRGSLLVSKEGETLACRLPASPHLRERIEGMHQSIDRAHKSARWQMRARVGDSARWVKTPTFHTEMAGKEASG